MQSKKSRLVLLATLFVALFTTQAFAKQKTYLSSYPAIVVDNEPTPRFIASEAARQSELDASPFDSHKAARRNALEASQAVSAPVAKEPAAPAPPPNVLPETLGYYPVPTGYADSIAARLKLTEKLIRDFNRAYDYRALTTNQLQEILSRLEQEKQSQKLN